jgi:hypothetical protein
MDQGAEEEDMEEVEAEEEWRLSQRPEPSYSRVPWWTTSFGTSRCTRGIS